MARGLSAIGRLTAVSGSIGYCVILWLMLQVHIIYASTSGHTEYVVDALRKFLVEKQSPPEVSVQIAEKAQPEDLTKGDLLILASGTWNTGGREGQMNPHMVEYLWKRVKDADLNGKQCAVIGLGDHRYKYTTRATEHMAHFIKEHGGHALLPPLVIVDDPYGKEGKVEKWGEALLSKLSSLEP